MLIVGLFFGVLIGWFANVVISDADSGQPIQPQQPAKKTVDPHGRKAPQDGGDPHAGAGAGAGHGASPDRAQQSIAKVHFMKKFVAALSGKPANKWPNPSYKPLLKEGAKAARCTDCHDSGTLNIEGMIKLDPGAEAVDKLRRSPNFMIPLMKKWVGRLNNKLGDRLAARVTCTSCHAIDPEEAWTALPPMMVSFVSALKTKPTNKNPAQNWKPLLKDPSTSAMLCNVCHGSIGEMMEKNIARFENAPRPEKYLNDKAFMVELMEHWVAKLNKNAGGMLTKAVVCLDCHDTDPRR